MNITDVFFSDLQTGYRHTVILFIFYLHFSYHFPAHFNFDPPVFRIFLFHLSSSLIPLFFLISCLSLFSQPFFILPFPLFFNFPAHFYLFHQFSSFFIHLCSSLLFSLFCYVLSLNFFHSVVLILHFPLFFQFSSPLLFVPLFIPRFIEYSNFQSHFFQCCFRLFSLIFSKLPILLLFYIQYFGFFFFQQGKNS